MNMGRSESRCNIGDSPNEAATKRSRAKQWCKTCFHLREDGIFAEGKFHPAVKERKKALKDGKLAHICNVPEEYCRKVAGRIIKEQTMTRAGYRRRNNLTTAEIEALDPNDTTFGCPRCLKGIPHSYDDEQIQPIIVREPPQRNWHGI